MFLERIAKLRLKNSNLEGIFADEGRMVGRSITYCNVIYKLTVLCAAGIDAETG
jgi:hypothetical protein